MSTSTVEIMNKGMQCLLEKLGVVETERFISGIIREQFDYTKWQQEYFDRMTPDEINAAAKKYVEEYPFKGNADTVL
jgi:hypothetical protein